MPNRAALHSDIFLRDVLEITLADQRWVVTLLTFLKVQPTGQ